MQAISVIPDLNYWGSEGGQFIPRYTYTRHETGQLDIFSSGEDAAEWVRVDNITDQALADYRQAYGPKVSKDDVFFYVYGLLHAPDYQVAFAEDLKKMLPRIPLVPTEEDFRAFVTAGRRLCDLHIGYEAIEPYPLKVTGLPEPAVSGKSLFDWFRVEKMRFAGKASAKDRSTIVYNSRITVTGIPEEAHAYTLGSRSAIEWVIERYQVKADKASGIVNDPNDWAYEHDQPRYILDLLARVVTVSVETVRTVAAMPVLDIATLR